MTEVLSKRPDVVEKYTKLVHFFAHKYRRFLGADHEDLVQSAWQYLSLYLPRFDPTRGPPEHTYVGQGLSWHFQSLSERSKDAKYARTEVEFNPELSGAIDDAFTEVETHADFRRLMQLLTPRERADVMRWLTRKGNVTRRGLARSIDGLSFETARQRYMKAIDHLRKVAK